ncbi:MAG: hypothetical protein ACXWG8_12920 [Usitatibacter sp.]
MRRLDAAIVAISVLAAAFAVLFTWQPGLASLHDDSVSYLVMAQAYSPFQAASDSVLAAAPHEKYPPLFPLLLALTGGAFDWRIAHAIVALAFGASVVLLGIHARQVTASAGIGFAAALAYAFMPGAWLNMKGILSEFPFMALSFGALILYQRGSARPPARGNAIALGALLAAALMTRTIGVALLLAVAGSELMRLRATPDARRLRLLPWTLGIPVATALLWYLLRPAAGEDAYASFGNRIAQEAAGQGVAWVLSLLQVNVSALVDAWLAALMIFWGEPWRPGFLLASALGIAGALATLWRAYRGEADALYCVAFVAILLAWPFPGQMFRLAFPVFPLLIVNFLWAWQRFLLRVSPAEAGLRAPLAVVLPLALCAPAMIFYVVGRSHADDEPGVAVRKSDITEFYRIPSGPSAAANALAQIAVFGDMERIRSSTPEGARVMWYTPGYISLLAQRHGVPLERPRDTADLAAQALAAKADYIYLAAIHPRDSSRRLGNPLDPLAFAKPFVQVAWHRDDRSGELQSVLLQIDSDRIHNNIRP